MLLPDIGNPIPRNGVVKNQAAMGGSYVSGIGAESDRVPRETGHAHGIATSTLVFLTGI